MSQKANNIENVLKLALEALQSDDYFIHVNAIKALKEALANHCEDNLNMVEQEQGEPVAWRGYNWSHSPDDWVYRDFDDPILDGNGNNVGQPLYTTPQQRTWVELTAEDRELIQKWTKYTAFMTPYEYAEAVQIATEAKLKEKNT